MRPRSVSVIITCFNLERYIGAAIKSVLDQDYRRLVDILVVDDCSTDRSAEIIRGFPAVRYVQTARNSGVLLATLRGIEAARGELLFFLDGDDVWEGHKLSCCVAALERDAGAMLVTHDVSFIDASGRAIARRSRPHAVLGPLGEVARSRLIVDGICRQDDFIWLGSAWGVRRSLGRVDGFVRWARGLADPFNTYQDWPLAMWIASLPAARAAYVPERLFRYRLHAANYSGDARNAERAARNFSRARNTLVAMHDLAVERGLPAEVRQRLADRVAANDYLACLYRGERRRALEGFRGAAADFRRRGRLVRELARFAGVQLLGPERFARAVARISTVRDRTGN